MDPSVSKSGHIHCCKLGFQSKIDNRMANSADPDETARNEPSHLKLHCFAKVSVLVKGLQYMQTMKTIWGLSYRWTG